MAALRVFVSYSHQDAARKQEIVAALQPLQDERLIEVWSDAHIGAGETWDDLIRAEIERCDVALMLVSDAFLQSDYCRRLEIPKLRELRRDRELRIVPVILSGAEWKNERWLSRTQVIPLPDMSALPRLLEEFRAIVERTRNTTPRPDTPEDVLLERLFDRNPVVNSSAADEWIARGMRNFEALSEKLAALRPWHMHSVQRVFASDPKAAAPLLERCVLETERNGPRAEGAADAFSIAQRDVTARALGEYLQRNTPREDGTARNCIRALGQRIAVAWQPEVVRWAAEERDACSKALAQFVAGSNDVREASYALEVLGRVVGDGTLPIAADRVFDTCLPVQGDAFIDQWSRHPNPRLRRRAARVLGRLRLARAVPELVHMLEDGDDSVRTEAAQALGSIGTERAVSAVLRFGNDDGILCALPFIRDRAVAIEHAGRLLDHKHAWRVIRTIGVCRLTELTDAVAERLHSRTAIERTVVPLALVRLGATHSFEDIRQSVLEASDRIERIFKTLAVVALDDSLPAEQISRFEADLFDSIDFLLPLHEDILEVLGQSDSSALARIARVWKTIAYRSPSVGLW